jgi:hypothetical protein
MAGPPASSPVTSCPSSGVRVHEAVGEHEPAFQVGVTVQVDHLDAGVGLAGQGQGAERPGGQRSASFR